MHDRPTTPRRRRGHLLALVLWALLSAGLGLGPGTQALAAPAAPAHHTHLLDPDPCGSQPNWWDALNWLAWEACETAQGNSPLAGIVEVTSPILNDIKAGIIGIPSHIDNLGSLISGLPSGIIGALLPNILPSSTDMQPLTDAIGGYTTHQPFAFIGALTTIVGNISSGWQTAAGSFSTTPDSTPSDLSSALNANVSVACGSYCPQGQSYNFGPLSGGVAIWLWFMNRIGMSQRIVADIMDTFCVLALMKTVLADLGVGARMVGETVQKMS